MFIGLWVLWLVNDPDAHASWAVVWLPFVMLLLSVTALGAGLIASSLTAKYRDLSHSLAFIVQVWMYLSPVVYPLRLVPEQFQWAMQLNPICFPIEWFRFAFLGNGDISLTGALLSGFSATLLLLAGCAIFGQVEKNFVDTV